LRPRQCVSFAIRLYGRNGIHPDFQQEWCLRILRDPSALIIPHRADVQSSHGDTVTNSMFEYTLYTERGIRAHLLLRRPCSELDSILSTEDCMLVSIGDGLDGKAGRAHGGFNALLLDQISGGLAHRARPVRIPPATATITIDYKAPISTPSVVLCRAWPLEMSGRKIWVKAVIEDERGKLLASSKSLFVYAKQTDLEAAEKL